MTSRASGSSEIFDGTHKRGAMFRKLYNAWVKLPDAEKGNVPLLTLMTGLNRRLVFEDILPQLREAQRLEGIGIDPFDIWSNLGLISDVSVEPTAEERKKAIEAQQARHNAMMSKKTGKKTGTRQGSNESGK